MAEVMAAPAKTPAALVAAAVVMLVEVVMVVTAMGATATVILARTVWQATIADKSLPPTKADLQWSIPATNPLTTYSHWRPSRIDRLLMLSRPWHGIRMASPHRISCIERFCGAEISVNAILCEPAADADVDTGHVPMAFHASASEHRHRKVVAA